MSGPVRVIAGSGRSGTTWVLDAVAHANRLRPVFEPLHPYAVPAAASYAYRYLPEDTEVPTLKAFLSQVFGGDFRSVWTDYRVRPDRLRLKRDVFFSIAGIKQYRRRWSKLIRNYREYRTVVARREVLVKFIRANLMLGWLRRTFDARIVFLLRHPAAVVESQLRLGGDDWEPYEHLARYRGDAEFQRSSVGRYDTLLEADLSPAEALTTIWCIENQHPLEQAERTGYEVVFYEHLIEEPEREWCRVVRALGLSGLPDAGLLTKPSQQASREWRTQRLTNDYRRWMDRISPPVSAEIDSVLRRLGVSVYAVGDPLPRISAAPPPDVEAIR